MHTTAPRPLLRDIDIAERCSISRRTARYLLERGDLPSIHVGRARRVDPDDFERWLAARTPRLDVPAEPRSWLGWARRAAAGATT